MNHELQDLITLATMMLLEDQEKKEGWEAFPSHEFASKAWEADLCSARAQGAGGPTVPHIPEPRKEQGAGGALESAPSAPSLSGASSDAGPWPPAPPPASRAYASAAPGGGGAGIIGSDILSMEPPAWLPDSHATHCMSCHLDFRPFTRLRHHCRLCGKIFCASCCHKRVLLPPRYGQRCGGICTWAAWRSTTAC